MHYNLFYTAQKMKFSIKYLFSTCDQIRRKLRVWSHLLKKLLMENFISCAVLCELYLVYTITEIRDLLLFLFGQFWGFNQ